MRFFLPFIIIFSFVKTSFGQTNKIEIQHLNIKDSSFIKNVKSIIEYEKNSTEDNHHFFKNGFGYIAVTIHDYVHGDTLIKYNVLPMMSNIGENDDSIVYPLYYTYIDGRPVLIYLSTIKNFASVVFSKKSKRFISELIKPFLEKTKDVQMYDENGKKAFRDKNFRVDYFKLSGGKDFFTVKRVISY